MLLAKMSALERLLLPSRCLDLWSMAAPRQLEALSGRASLPGSLYRPCYFVPLFLAWAGDNGYYHPLSSSTTQISLASAY